MEANYIYISSGDESDPIIVISSDDEIRFQDQRSPPRRKTKRKATRGPSDTDSGRYVKNCLKQTPATITPTDKIEDNNEIDDEISKPKAGRSPSAELLERHTQLALRLSLLDLDHTSGERFINMGQGDEPPAKKWKLDTEDAVSPITNKCLSDIGNKSRPQLIMRRRSSKDFFRTQKEEIVTDELPDLAVDGEPFKSSPKKHRSPSDKLKKNNIHLDKHRTKHKSVKQQTPSRSHSVISEKHHSEKSVHSVKHRKSEKHRTKSLECDSSSRKHVISSKHRHTSKQYHKHRISSDSIKDMKEKRPSSSELQQRHSNHSHHRDSHEKHSHKHKIKDKTAKNELKLHVCAGSDCKDCGIKESKKVVRRLSDSLKKEKFLADNDLGLKCHGCISPRVLLEKRDMNSGHFDFGKNHFENNIACAQIDTSTEIEYERDTDRDSCDGHSDNVSSTNMNLGSAGANLNLNFKITAEKKRHLASVLKRAHISSNASSDNSSNECKRVRRVSADTSTNLIGLPLLPASDCASECGSVSSISNRHFLDALSDVQDDCVSVASSDKKDNHTVTEHGTLNTEMPALNLNESVASTETCALKTIDSLPDSDDAPLQEKTEVTSPLVPASLDEDIQETEAVVENLEDTAVEVTEELPKEDFCNIESNHEDFDSCHASPCGFIDTDSLPDLEAPINHAFENDLDLFDEPSSSLCGDGRVIHAPSCHPCLNSFLNLRSTYEFSAMHSNSVDANFQEGHDADALELMHSFTTSARGPTRQLLEKVVNDVLCENKSDLKCQGYDLLMYVQQLHPPDHRCSFSRSFMSDVMDRCEKLLKGGGTNTSDDDILGIILAVQYCVSSLEAELMSRKLGSRREIGKSIISRWFSLETSYGRVENLISWLTLAVKFDDLVKSRSRSVADDNPANALGFHMSLLSELLKLLSLAIAVSTEPSAHCTRVARSFYQVMDQADDTTGEKIRCSVSNPLLGTKILEMLSGDVASLYNMSEEFGKSCMVAELCYVADYFLAQWKVEEENLEMPLHRRVLEACRPDHRKTAQMIEKFLVNVKNENSNLEDDVYVAQLECQLEALDLDTNLINDS